MAVPPQRAPNAEGLLLLDFLAHCEQIEKGHDEGPLLLDIFANCKQIEKDFYRHREAAKRNKTLIERRCQDKASHAKAVADEFTKRRRHTDTAQTTVLAELALAKKLCRHDAAMQMAMSAASSLADERHHHEAVAQAAELAVLLLA